jgi:hypothetical protein
MNNPAGESERVAKLLWKYTTKLEDNRTGAELLMWAIIAGFLISGSAELGTLDTYVSVLHKGVSKHYGNQYHLQS